LLKPERAGRFGSNVAQQPRPAIGDCFDRLLDVMLLSVTQKDDVFMKKMGCDHIDHAWREQDDRLASAGLRIRFQPIQQLASLISVGIGQMQNDRRDRGVIQECVSGLI
jgi:hypothetical protein